MPTTRPSSSPPSARPRALVVSHPCIVPVNQSVFNVVAERGWSVDLVVPARWRHDYADGEVAPGRLPDLKARFIPAPVALPGQPQRHLYRPGVTSRVLAEPSPAVAFLEEETFSVPAFQWGVACRRRGIPFGVQADENLDRPLPLPAQLLRAWTLRNAAFVAARSPKAKEMVERWGARGRVEVIPHAVPLWDTLPRPESSGVFTIGFAGRFVEEKGLRDLVSAAHRLTGQTRLLLTGNGPMREELSGVARNGLEVEIVSDISHDDMATAYARMDVLVLPSRTTPTWAEQFGRVLVEALWCGVPVIGSDSGEIPWVINTTGGGLLFPEGDVDALANALFELRADPAVREALAGKGRESVERLFAVSAVGAQLDRVMREVSAQRAVV
jgi:glycosyltransferase involved in cell wall biosynthesis